MTLDKLTFMNSCISSCDTKKIWEKLKNELQVLVLPKHPFLKFCTIWFEFQKLLTFNEYVHKVNLTIEYIFCFQNYLYKNIFLPRKNQFCHADDKDKFFSITQLLIWEALIAMFSLDSEHFKITFEFILNNHEFKECDMLFKAILFNFRIKFLRILM